MSEKSFVIKSIEDIKFVEMPDMRDQEPTMKEFNPDIPILDLVKMTCPSYDICNHPLIKKYGYGTFGATCENWYWDDNIINASEEELWKIFALIKASDAANYRYMYQKEVYEFRKFKREMGMSR